ncbi:MAG: MarR family transcriptional regulator [Steroidobacteraceae bacterium]
MGRAARPIKKGAREARKVGLQPAFKTVVGNRDLRLGFLIHDVSRLRRLAFDQLMKPIGVTRSQWWVIAYLSRHDGMKQTELADLLDVGRVSLGALVDRLEASKCVIRKPDPNDRRAKLVFLTPAAHKLLSDMRNAEDEMNARILRGVSAQQRAVLFDLLAQLKHNLMDVVAGEAALPDEEI